MDNIGISDGREYAVLGLQLSHNELFETFLSIAKRLKSRETLLYFRFIMTLPVSHSTVTFVFSIESHQPTLVRVGGEAVTIFKTGIEL